MASTGGACRWTDPMTGGHRTGAGNGPADGLPRPRGGTGDAPREARPGAGAAPRVAILGAGLMGRWHADAARRLGAQVVGFADPDIGRARALAARHPGATAVADPAALLAPGRVDAVHLCTPLPTHAALAGQAIGQGLHVLAEKPLAATAAETRRLLDRARAAGVVLCPVHQIGFQDGVTRAAAMLDGLGPLSRIAFDIGSAGGAGQPPAALDAIVGDILPHPLSVLRRLFPGVPLQAGQWGVQHPRPGDLLLGGEHAGAMLSICISMNARPPCFGMALWGQGGGLQLDLFHGFVLRRPGGVSRLHKAARPFAEAAGSLVAATANLGRRTLRREAAYPGLRSLVRGFYAAIAGAAAWPVPPEDTLEVALARDRVLARMGLGTGKDPGAARPAALQPLAS